MRASIPSATTVPPFGAAAIDELDLRHNWHPFTQMREYAAAPRLHIACGRGCWLHDSDGNRYLDGNASLWTHIHGHADPDLDAALREQLDSFAHATYLGLNHPPGAMLAARLATLTRGRLPRVFYSDNGSGAVEIALKLSLQFRQLSGEPERTGIIALRDAYHGDTFGAMSVGDNGIFHERFRRWFFPVDRFPAPRHVECNGRVLTPPGAVPAPGDSLAALDSLLAQKAATTSCLVMEPCVQGSAGMRLHPPGFVRTVAGRCRSHGIHLILDEVFTGCGRLGSMLACETEGVTPDFLCLAKGLAAGYLPLAATLTTENIHAAFLGDHAEYRAFFHGHTFTGNPLACAVALRSIEKLDVIVASGALAGKIAAFGAGLEKTFAAHPHVSEIRQRGMTAAIDLRPAASNTGAAFPPAFRAGYRVCLEARRRGLILRPLGDSLLLVPPLAINHDEIAFLLRVTRDAIDAVLPAFRASPATPAL